MAVEICHCFYLFISYVFVAFIAANIMSFHSAHLCPWNVFLKCIFIIYLLHLLLRINSPIFVCSSNLSLSFSESPYSYNTPQETSWPEHVCRTRFVFPTCDPQVRSEVQNTLFWPEVCSWFSHPKGASAAQ